MASTKFSIKQVVLPPSEYTAITATIRCNGIGFSATEDVNIRSDSADATTQALLGASMQEGIIGPMLPTGRSLSDAPVRFDAGEIIFYASPAGTSTITGTIRCVY